MGELLLIHYAGMFLFANLGCRLEPLNITGFVWEDSKYLRT